MYKILYQNLSYIDYNTLSLLSSNINVTYGGIVCDFLNKVPFIYHSINFQPNIIFN